MKSIGSITALALALALSPVAGAGAADKIGGADQVINLVEGTLDEKTKSIHESDQVYQEEVVRTGRDSGTKIIFLDQTELKLGPDSDITLDAFVYDADPSKGRMVVSVSSGVMRFVTGNLASESYAIETPTATMGVRGTSFDMIVEDDGETTVAVREGEVMLSNLIGEAIIIPAGLSSSVAPAAADGTRNPPSALSPPSEGFEDRIALMDNLFAGFFGTPNTLFANLMQDLDWSKVLAWSAALVLLIPLVTGGLSVVSISGAVAAALIVLWLLFG